MPKDGGPSVGVRKHRSRITNRKKLLPSIHPQSVWGRLYRDNLAALEAHLGGEDYASAPQFMHARYAAVLDTELIYQADRIGTIRNNGGEPEPGVLDRLRSRPTIPTPRPWLRRDAPPTRLQWPKPSPA